MMSGWAGAGGGGGGGGGDDEDDDDDEDGDDGAGAKKRAAPPDDLDVTTLTRLVEQDARNYIELGKSAINGVLGMSNTFDELIEAQKLEREWQEQKVICDDVDDDMKDDCLKECEDLLRRSQNARERLRVTSDFQVRLLRAASAAREAGGCVNLLAVLGTEELARARAVGAEELASAQAAQTEAETIAGKMRQQIVAEAGEHAAEQARMEIDLQALTLLNDVMKSDLDATRICKEDMDKEIKELTRQKKITDEALENNDIQNAELLAQIADLQADLGRARREVLGGVLMRLAPPPPPPPPDPSRPPFVPRGGVPRGAWPVGAPEQRKYRYSGGPPPLMRIGRGWDERRRRRELQAHRERVQRAQRDLHAAETAARARRRAALRAPPGPAAAGKKRKRDGRGGRRKTRRRRRKKKTRQRKKRSRGGRRRRKRRTKRRRRRKKTRHRR